MSLPVTPTPTPAAGPSPSANGGADNAEPGGFARELTRATGDRHQPAGKDDGGPQGDAETSPVARKGAADKAHESRRAGKEAGRAQARAPRNAAADAAKDAKATEADEAAKADPAEDDDPAAAADLDAVMAMVQRAGMQQQQQQPGAGNPKADAPGQLRGAEFAGREPAGRDPLARAGGVAVAGAEESSKRGTAAVPGDVAGTQAQQPEANRAKGQDTFQQMVSAAQGDREAQALQAQALVEKQGTAEDRKASEPAGDSTPLQAASAAMAAPSTKAAEAAAPAATIQAPTHSKEFAPALAAQVSIFAKDGVQEAKLHLNPAETGPITVRISVENAQARVDFVAAHAETRSAIETSLPDLAASLREAGLTLAGGGVFQQSAGQQGREGQPDERSFRVGGIDGSRGGANAGDDAASVQSVAQRPIAPRGAVDLYA